MSLELIYTSAPRGLKPESNGFCTVAATAGMSKIIMMKLESLSGYDFLFNLSDDRATQNPINYIHTRLDLGQTSASVLSRVAFAGSDHTGRANKIAHHILLSDNERSQHGPAWMAAVLEQSGRWTSRWDQEPKTLQQTTMELAGSLSSNAWNKLTGDAGWAGMIARSYRTKPKVPVFIVFAPGTDILPLIAEALNVLTPPERWQVHFATYFTRLPPGSPCLLRGVVAGSKAAAEIARYPDALAIDLTRPLPTLPDDPYIEAARNGRIMEVGSSSKHPSKSGFVDIRQALVAQTSHSEDSGEYKLLEPEDQPRVRSTPRPSRPTAAAAPEPRNKLLLLAILGGVAILLFGFGIGLFVAFQAQTSDPPIAQSDGQGTPVTDSRSGGDDSDTAPSQHSSTHTQAAQASAPPDSEREAGDSDELQEEARKKLEASEDVPHQLDEEQANAEEDALNSPTAHASLNIDNPRYRHFLLPSRRGSSDGHTTTIIDNFEKTLVCHMEIVSPQESGKCLVFQVEGASRFVALPVDQEVKSTMGNPVVLKPAGLFRDPDPFFKAGLTEDGRLIVSDRNVKDPRSSWIVLEVADIDKQKVYRCVLNREARREDTLQVSQPDIHEIEYPFAQSIADSGLTLVASDTDNELVMSLKRDIEKNIAKDAIQIQDTTIHISLTKTAESIKQHRKRLKDHEQRLDAEMDNIKEAVKQLGQLGSMKPDKSNDKKRTELIAKLHERIAALTDAKARDKMKPKLQQLEQDTLDDKETRELVDELHTLFSARNKEVLKQTGQHKKDEDALRHFLNNVRFQLLDPWGVPIWQAQFDPKR